MLLVDVPSIAFATCMAAFINFLNHHLRLIPEVAPETDLNPSLRSICLKAAWLSAAKVSVLGANHPLMRSMVDRV